MKVGNEPANDKRPNETRPGGMTGGESGESPPPALPLTAREQRFDIRIARDGTWFHEGDPIRRIELVKLFATVLRRDGAGDFWLVTPVERGRIVVEDTPFVAVEMAASGDGDEQVVSFRTNLDEWVECGPDHPIRVVHNPENGEPTPYILIRNGLEARILRSVYYELVDRADTRGHDGEAEVGVWSKKVFFVLGRLPGG
ncbi:proteophosphoglycan precursor (plasmid) [Azospirillum sp. TSH58]|uniref:DUF1285 domain-containing protein n=1 Tax=Azospirillum sp. TSH58 TaxID=664962 RepID=UPI000D602755|nr:DUF1285 domain-containing protein [Azospirillum sp. TSH58]AWJ86535.1 proteophosphoglycan precursor [Azospirillum sp. TSH58]